MNLSKSCNKWLNDFENNNSYSLLNNYDYNNDIPLLMFIFISNKSNIFTSAISIFGV